MKRNGFLNFSLLSAMVGMASIPYGPLAHLGSDIRDIPSRGGRYVSNKRKRPGKYIPGGKHRNCGWYGISPKMFYRAAAQTPDAQ